ncbi:MAG: TIGR03016 family PEP-CTERM system-associated outer membrane protein [Halioglobus sp.]
MNLRVVYTNRFLRPQLCIICGLTWAGGVYAANWNGNISVAPSIAYTDNVCLSKDNKQGDWTAVGLLTPSGSVSRKTRKSSFSARGSVQVNTLTNGDLEDKGCGGDNLGDRQTFFPSITALGSTVVIDDWVNLNATLRADQNEVTSALPSSNDNLNRNGNTNTFYRYSLSPILSHRLKNQAKYTLRYTYDDQINTSDAVSDSTRHLLNTSLASGRESRVSWDLSGRYSRVEYNDEVFNRYTGEFGQREDSKLRSAGLTLGYQFNRKWQVNGRYGWEWNDFRTFNGQDPSGSDWDVGLRWTPTERTTVEVGSGDRFFGTTPRVNIKHQRKRSLFRASYRKTITYQRDISTLNDGFFSGNTVEESLINNGNVDQEFIVGTGANSSLYSNGPILDERGTLGYTYTGRRATTDVFGSYSEQTRAEDGAQGVFKNVTVSFSPKISRTYSLTGSITWDNNDPLGYKGVPGNVQDFGESEAWYYSLQVSRPLNNRMSLSVNYQYTDRQSDDPFNEYQENRVIATLNISL